MKKEVLHFKYYSTYRERNIYIASNGYFYIQDDQSPFESCTEACDWIDLTTPIETEQYTIESGIINMVHLGERNN